MGKYTKVFNLSAPNDPYQTLRTIDQTSYDYVRFGTDNLYPHALSELNRKSNYNRSLIKSKTTYTIGKGFSTEDTKLKDYIANVNGKEALRSIIKPTIRDKYQFGNGYIELISNSGMGFLNMHHVDATKVRVNKDNETVTIHPDWVNYTSSQNAAKVVALYPAFSEGDDGLLHSIIHIYDYEPEFFYYGVPDYIAATDTATIAYKTDKWNLSRLDNNFKLSGVLVIEDDIQNIEEAKELKDKVLSEFTGEGNNDKIMVIVKEPGQQQATSFTPITTNTEGDWEKLHDQAGKDLVVAHNWRRSLIGFSDNTGFDTDRILNDYNDVLFNVVQPEQEGYLEILKKVFTQFGYNAEDLAFENKPPISPKRALLTLQQMEGIGLVQQKLDDKSMDEEQAINVLKLSYLIDTKQAKGLLRTKKEKK